MRRRFFFCLGFRGSYRHFFFVSLFFPDSAPNLFPFLFWCLFSTPRGPNWGSNGVLLAALGRTCEALRPIFGSFLGRLGPQGSQLGARGVPKVVKANRWHAFWVIWGSILGVFFGSFLDNFSDVFFEGLLALIFVNFGAALDPKGALKSRKNVER